MFDIPQTDPLPAPKLEAHSPAGSADIPAIPKRITAAPCTPADGEEIVVCANTGQPYRLPPLPPLPPPDGLLSKPLRVTLAPGVTFGLQPRSGIGLRAQFGPGAKEGDAKTVGKE